MQESQLITEGIEALSKAQTELWDLRSELLEIVTTLETSEGATDTPIDQEAVLRLVALDSTLQGTISKCSNALDRFRQLGSSSTAVRQPPKTNVSSP